MKQAIISFFGFLALIAGSVAAQVGTPNFDYPNRVINQGSAYLTTAVTILMVLMTVWFLISIFNFIRESDATKRNERKKQVISGLIGLFIAVAVWGIIRIAQNITGTGGAGTPNITCPPGYQPGLPGTPNAGTCVRR